MQYKALATLLFATAALAAPTSDSTISYDDYLDEIDLPYMTETIPSEILSVIETAIPTTWYQALETDSAFQSSVINDLLHSTYPAWYSSLPESVKSWATVEGEAEVSALSSYFSDMPTVTPTSGSGSSSGASSTPLSTGHTSTSTSSQLTLTSTATQTKSASSSSSTSSSASGSGTSTSTGGAPAATGGLAISLAGAAGVLGLALAL